MQMFFESVFIILGREGAYLRYCVRLLEGCYTKILMVRFFWIIEFIQNRYYHLSGKTPPAEIGEAVD